MASWIPESYEFCSEPIFAPSTNPELKEEDDGYLLSTLWNGKTVESELIILSAKDMSLQARVPLGIAIPHGLYGFFSVGDNFTAEEIDRRVKLAEKMESRGNMWNEVKSDFSGLGLRLDDLEEYFGDIM
jgi:all-trans-8'-apo-beta-carotenal 15,15'-oxygenase